MKKSMFVFTTILIILFLNCSRDTNLTKKVTLKDGKKHVTFSEDEEGDQPVREEHYDQSNKLTKILDLKTGLETRFQYHQNGIKKSQEEFKDGLKNGTSNFWDYKGRKIQTLMYKHDLLHGKTISWNENGVINGEGHFSNGTGRFTVFYKSNNKKFELILDKGDGSETGWYETGGRKYCTSFESCKKTGEFKLWYENEKLSVSGVYKNGEKNGTFHGWYPTGKSKFKNAYIEGREHGRFVQWYENGNKKHDIGFKTGQWDGDYLEWWENGKLKRKGFYKNGKEDGLAITKFKNGKLQSRCEFKEGLYHGEYISWYEDGGIASKGIFSEGIGEVKEWYKSGQIKSVSMMKRNKIHGKFIQYYQNGNKELEIDRMIDGVENGLRVSWYENGQIRSREMISNGKKHGSCVYWNENGKKIKEELWDEGELKQKVG